MAVGVVREWHDEEGWGVFDSDDTPGGCWAHFSALSMEGYRRASPGQRVTFTCEQSEQDGFDFRALVVTLDGVAVLEPEGQPLRPGHLSRLTIEQD